MVNVASDHVIRHPKSKVSHLSLESRPLRWGCCSSALMASYRVGRQQEGRGTATFLTRQTLKMLRLHVKKEEEFGFYEFPVQFVHDYFDAVTVPDKYDIDTLPP